MPANTTSHPIKMDTPIDETTGNVIAKTPKIINMIDSTIEAPDARFNPASIVVINSPYYGLRSTTKTGHCSQIQGARVVAPAVVLAGLDDAAIDIRRGSDITLNLAHRADALNAARTVSLRKLA